LVTDRLEIGYEFVKNRGEIKKGENFENVRGK
jgi:hypothetical protein